MKTPLKPLLIGSACGVVTFSLSGWLALSLLWHYRGLDQVQTDPDYHAAMALGAWISCIQAIVCGALVGLATVALMTWYWYRRNKRSVPRTLPS
jgi:hypothetical protein